MKNIKLNSATKESMKKRKTILSSVSVVLASGVCIFSFQNCSNQHGFSAAGSEALASRSPSSSSDTSTGSSDTSTSSSGNSNNSAGANSENENIDAASTVNTVVQSFKVYYLVNNKVASVVNDGQAYQVVAEVGSQYWDIVLNTELSGQELVYAPNYQGQGYADPGSVVKMVVKSPDLQRIDGNVSFIDSNDESKGWIFKSNPIIANRNIDTSVVAQVYTARGVAGPQVSVALTVNSAIQNSPPPSKVTSCSYAGSGYTTSGQDIVVSNSATNYYNKGQACQTSCSALGSSSWWVYGGSFCHCGTGVAVFNDNKNNVDNIGGNCN